MDEKSKITFTSYSNTLGDKQTVTYQFESDGSLDQILNHVEYFLRSLSFHVDSIQHVKDEENT